jgi:flagellin-like hook-associated protein FlgL
MRANLASLQSTATLLGQTQERLATGNKVNSALDNPSSFFAAQGLNNRASDLSSLLDSMGQSIQALQAASKGIDGLTALLNQAKSTAQQALSEATGGASAIGAVSFTAAGQANIVGFNGITAADTIVVQRTDAAGTTNVGPSTTITIGASETLAQLLSDLNAVSGVSATTVADAANPGQVFVQIRTTDGGGVKLTNGTGTEVAKIFGASVTSGTALAATNTSPVDRTALENTFAAIAGANGQISQLVKDTGYAGKNLLGGDTLKVQFNETNTTSITITGTKRDAAGLGLTAANIGTFDTTGHIQSTIDAITAALNTLRNDGSYYGNGLAVIQARQDFTNALISTLKDGATSLTIADKNEEGANLLALQTSQQLGIQALALASQANQSVLRLFA